jgi:hypothetical protein
MNKLSISESSVGRRRGGVTLAAILLLLVGTCTQLAGCMSLATSVESASWPPPLPKIPANILHRELVLGLFLLSVGSLYIAIAWALFRRRTWARVGAMVIGILQAVSSLSVSAFGVAAVFALPANSPLDPHAFRVVMYSISGGFLVPTVMGIWLVIFFSRYR